MLIYSIRSSIWTYKQHVVEYLFILFHSSILASKSFHYRYLKLIRHSSTAASVLCTHIQHTYIKLGKEMVFNFILLSHQVMFSFHVGIQNFEANFGHPSNITSFKRMVEYRWYYQTYRLGHFIILPFN